MNRIKREIQGSLTVFVWPNKKVWLVLFAKNLLKTLGGVISCGSFHRSILITQISYQ